MISRIQYNREYSMKFLNLLSIAKFLDRYTNDESNSDKDRKNSKSSAAVLFVLAIFFGLIAIVEYNAPVRFSNFFGTIYIIISLILIYCGVTVILSLIKKK